MIQEELKAYASKCIELMAKCTAEAFNNNYNLTLTDNQILNNLTSPESKTETEAPPDEKEASTENPETKNETEELAVLMENLCIARKKDGYLCNKKVSQGVLCGIHNSLNGKIPLQDFIKMVADEKKYEVLPKVVVIGNNFAEDAKIDKWPQIITTTSTNFFNGNILFFTEYQDYLGAGIFVVQYNSHVSKKQSHCFASHYVEVNRYCETLGGNVYVKINFTPLSKFENKPIYHRITDMLNAYGIPYNLSQIVKGKRNYTSSSPIVTFNKINDILSKHNNVMFFNSDDYFKVCRDTDESDSSDSSS